jgi:hypothetical protein
MSVLPASGLEGIISAAKPTAPLDNSAAKVRNCMKKAKEKINFLWLFV